MADKQLLEGKIVSISPGESYESRNGTIYKSLVKFSGVTIHESGDPATGFDETIEWEQGHKTVDNPWEVGEVVTFIVAQTGQYNRIKKERPYDGGGSSKKSSSSMQPSKSFSNSSSNNDERSMAIELQSSMKLAMDAVVSDGGSSTDFSLIESTTLKFYEMLQRMKKTVS